MGEIKSAWEIAMERVEGLGKLSPEELRKQKEEEYALIGQVLADKYLGGLGFWQLEVELDKYGAEERELVKRALISKLAQAIELGNYERLDKAMEGISGLKQKKRIKEIKDEIEQLFQEYKQVEEKESREVEKSAREILHQLRISGSAIGTINPKVIPQWQQGLDRLAQPYQEKLERLKQKLIDLSRV
jgi:hypothetical protein